VIAPPFVKEGLQDIYTLEPTLAVVIVVNVEGTDIGMTVMMLEKLPHP
jgi:hypothetical protein